MILGPDLPAMGLAATLAHPGGNITGQTYFSPEVEAKRLEFLKSLVPVDDSRGRALAPGLRMRTPLDMSALGDAGAKGRS